MTQLDDCFDPLQEVEALVLSARNYVHASEDLRPRVLETARAECGERRARRCTGQIALALVLWGLCATSGVDHATIAVAQQSVSERVLERAQEKAAEAGDYGSGFVDAFVELREQQAEVLRLAL
jgi:hypothetical protein